MFSRDLKHYRATPRTTSEAFGPYHSFQQSHRRTKLGILCAAAGVIALGVVYGFLFAWRG
jgi:hypothetical protein